MKSMTGYGETELTSENGIIINIEVRSYNRKHLDTRITMPPDFFKFEQQIKKFATNWISRGVVNIKISIDYTPERLADTIEINRDLAKTYMEKIEEVKDYLNIFEDVKLSDILRLPNVITLKHKQLDENDVKNTLFKVLEKAFKNFDDTREAEGLFLFKDISQRINNLEKMLEKIVPLAEELPLQHRAKLQKRVEEANITLEDNNDRLLRELVLFADKLDVSEEITRLKSHFKQFKALLENSSVPIGRKMDFLIQEINREINTLGVKAASIEISQIVVDMKAESEKIREQIQNIE